MESSGNEKPECENSGFLQLRLTAAMGKVEKNKGSFSKKEASIIATWNVMVFICIEYFALL